MEGAMRRHWRLVKMALRAASWRATAVAPAIGLAGLAGWTVLTVLCLVATEYWTTGGSFSEYGLGLVLGEIMLSITIGALALRAENWVAASTALLIISFFIVSVLGALLDLLSLPQVSAIIVPSMRIGAIIAIVALCLVWQVGAYAAIIWSFYSHRRFAGWGRALGVCAAQMVVLIVFPHYPAFLTREVSENPPNIWVYARTLFPQVREEADDGPERVDGARVELAQPALMDEAIARLAPQTRGETDVYTIGIAGWAEQDVFIKELDGALAVVGKVLRIRDRTLRLVNHIDSVERTPVALRANFAAAVRAVARVMDRDEDVLLLFMTSHGSPDGIALRLPGLISTGLAPEDVAAVLDREGIKNRIVVVSACYSGVFIKPLANDNTIVITAADEKSTSFGCSNEREWTYFGDAFFNHNLRPGVSIEEAFLDAKVTIGQWEAAEGLTPLNPQGHFGPALMAKLARVYGSSRQAEQTNTP
jgi:hypothetical protein